MQRVRRQGRKRSHLITGTARLGKKNAGARRKKPVFDPVSQCEPVPHLRIRSGGMLRSKCFAQFPQRDRKPRQPPAWPDAEPTCSANSSVTGSSSSIPGSSGARTMGITGRMLAGTFLGMSWRERNSGAGGADADSVDGGDGLGGGAGAGSGVGKTMGAGSTAAATTGELSCAAGGSSSVGGSTTAGASRGGSTRRGAEIAALNSAASIAVFLSEGNAASGRCH